MQASPNSLEENLARSVTGTSRGQAFSFRVLSLKLRHGVANLRRCEATFAGHVLEDGLRRRRLREAADRIRIVASKAGLTTAVLAAHAYETNLSCLVTAHAVRLRQAALLHLSHGHKQRVGDEVAIVHINKFAVRHQILDGEISHIGRA